MEQAKIAARRPPSRRSFDEKPESARGARFPPRALRTRPDLFPARLGTRNPGRSGNVSGHRRSRSRSCQLRRRRRTHGTRNPPPQTTVSSIRKATSRWAEQDDSPPRPDQTGCAACPQIGARARRAGHLSRICQAARSETRCGPLPPVSSGSRTDRIGGRSCDARCS